MYENSFKLLFQQLEFDNYEHSWEMRKLLIYWMIVSVVAPLQTKKYFF